MLFFRFFPFHSHFLLLSAHLCISLGNLLICSLTSLSTHIYISIRNDTLRILSIYIVKRNSLPQNLTLDHFSECRKVSSDAVLSWGWKLLCFSENILWTLSFCMARSHCHSFFMDEQVSLFMYFHLALFVSQSGSVAAPTFIAVHTFLTLSSSE